VRRIAVLDAPSNLGLRPPTETSVPGCAKAPGALRDHGLLTKLAARDAGCLTPPRYDAGDWRPGDGVAHAAQIAAYSRALADRIGAILDAGEFPVILGGDCSILLGSGIAMHRLGEAVGGRIGLVFVDGHSDFRHPGNSSYVGAAAGEDLALVTGRGQADLTAIESRRPYFRDVDVVVLGIRAQDEYRLDLQAAGIVTRPVPALRAEGAARSAQWAREQLVDCAGYWVHIDVDVLDPAVMPAVDAPSPGGIAFPELELLLAGLVESPHCLGVEITVFDPDYDPDGLYATEISSTIAAGLAAARTVNARPDLTAVRADLASPSRPVTVRRAAGGFPFGPAPTTDDGPGPGRGRGQTVDDDPVADDASAEPDQVDDTAFAPIGLAEAGADTVPSAGTPLGSPLGAATAPAGPTAPAAAGRDAPEGDVREYDALAREAGEGDVREYDALEREAREGDVREYDARDVRVYDALERDARDGDVREHDVREHETGDGDGGDAVEDEADDALAESGVRLVPRPLGSAPLLDSEPLPATRPGMLRPRAADETRYAGFTLPTQRPAFENGSDEPADIA
jgi:arginase